MRRDDVGGADGRKVGADSSIREVTLFSPDCMPEVRQNREFGLGSRFCCPCGSQIPWSINFQPRLACKGDDLPCGCNIVAEQRWEHPTCGWTWRLRAEAIGTKRAFVGIGETAALSVRTEATVAYFVAVEGPMSNEARKVQHMQNIPGPSPSSTNNIWRARIGSTVRVQVERPHARVNRPHHRAAKPASCSCLTVVALAISSIRIIGAHACWLRRNTPLGIVPP